MTDKKEWGEREALHMHIGGELQKAFYRIIMENLERHNKSDAPPTDIMYSTGSGIASCMVELIKIGDSPVITERMAEIMKEQRQAFIDGFDYKMEMLSNPESALRICSNGTVN